jgi:hypothetical protein
MSACAINPLCARFMRANGDEYETLGGKASWEGG